MGRTQFLAAVVLVAAIAGLLLSRFDFGSGATTDEADEGVTIVGGEQAQTDSSAPPAEGPANNDATAGTSSSVDTGSAVEPPPVLEPKPELTGLDGWLQAPASAEPLDGNTIGLASFDGQVRIVQFWTFGCHNCKATIPHLQELYARHHHDDGRGDGSDSVLEIIGIHAPEFDWEADVGNIQTAAIELGVTWPIALDTDKVNFRAWQGSRRFWPRTYVLDQDGQVRFDHIGEGRYDDLADTVEYLLANGP